MTRKDIVDCFDDVKTTEIQKQKMLNTILTGNNIVVLPVIRKKRLSLAAIAAVAALLFLTTTTALAVTFGWHEALFLYFNPTDEQVQILDGQVQTYYDTDGASNITITQSGLTVTVLQSIADSYGVYVFYEIITEDETFEFPEETYVGSSILVYYEPETSVAQERYSPACVTSGAGTAIILENFGNRLLVLQYFYSTGPTRIGNVELVITEINYPTDERDNDGPKVEPLFVGYWSLGWELDFVVNEEIILLPEVTIEESGAINIVKQIVISPLSVIIFFEGDMFRPDQSFIDILINDGSSISFGADCQNSIFTRVATNAIPGVEHDGTEDSFDQSLHYIFGTIINVNDLESINIGDIEIPISG